jgi:hypothetical protein
MLSIGQIKFLSETFDWFLNIGAADAKKMRDELQDLLGHCAQTIKAAAELAEALYQIKAEEFSEDTFRPIFLHCVKNYTSPEAARRARSHCTDIERDVGRIKFRLAKVLRADDLQWKSLDQQFAKFADADGDFLVQFEHDMQLVQTELQEILGLAQTDCRQAWQKYEKLRTTLMADLSKLTAELKKMREAEDHIRRILV